MDPNISWNNTPGQNQTCFWKLEGFFVRGWSQILDYVACFVLERRQFPAHTSDSVPTEHFHLLSPEGYNRAPFLHSSVWVIPPQW